MTPPATLEDTTFRVILVGLTIFGEAIAGNALRHSAGLTDPDAPDRFREWLARLLIDSE